MWSNPRKEEIWAVHIKHVKKLRKDYGKLNFLNIKKAKKEGFYEN
jgi:hypothetical protein